MSAAEDENCDWVDIERPLKPGVVRADVTARVVKPRPDKPARAYLTFRGAACVWIEKATRFRCQIGGGSANLIRLLPDDAGRFEAAASRLGVSQTVRLGIVTAWPDEVRALTECAWRLSGFGGMILTLPDDWARPRAAAKPSLPAPVRPAPASPFPVTTAAPGLASIAAERDELAEREALHRELSTEAAREVVAVKQQLRVLAFRLRALDRRRA